jgi:hypothetical protein
VTADRVTLAERDMAGNFYPGRRPRHQEQIHTSTRPHTGFVCIRCLLVIETCCMQPTKDRELPLTTTTSSDSVTHSNAKTMFLYMYMIQANSPSHTQNTTKPKTLDQPQTRTTDLAATQNARVCMYAAPPPLYQPSQGPHPSTHTPPSESILPVTYYATKNSSPHPTDPNQHKYTSCYSSN